VKKIALSVIFSLSLCSALLSSPSTSFKTDPRVLFSKVATRFGEIKDAQGDFRLETKVYLFGCSGTTVYEGPAYYKYPDRIKVTVKNKTSYMAQGNIIRKTDPQGKITYYKILYAPDCSIGYRPELVPYNFDLKTIAESSAEVVIEGLPKPGVLKNVKRVVFHIDPAEYLIRKLDIIFTNEYISGSAVIHYAKVDGLVVPVATEGKSAFQLRTGALVGFDFKLTSGQMKVNAGVPDRVFD
jgi:hypothetical protein